MKKILAMLLALVMTVAIVGCTNTEDAETPDVKGEGVMTYAEYAAAELQTEVVIETFIQAKQGWWENNGVGMATFYTQDTEGGYFLYNLPCSKGLSTWDTRNCVVTPSV